MPILRRRGSVVTSLHRPAMCDSGDINNKYDKTRGSGIAAPVSVRLPENGSEGTHYRFFGAPLAGGDGAATGRGGDQGSRVSRHRFHRWTNGSAGDLHSRSGRLGGARAV